MAGDQDSQNCLDIPTIKVGQYALETAHSCQGHVFHDAYQALSPKVFEILDVENRNGAVYATGSATGFFIQDGIHALTNAHVVDHASTVLVLYDNHTYSAKVEKLDPINDLAELEIIGLAPDASRAQSLEPAPLATNERIFAVGEPGDSRTKYLSPGILRGPTPTRLYGIDNIEQFYSDPKAKSVSLEVQRIWAAINSGDPVLASMARERANAPVLMVTQGTRAGNSGSPEADALGNFFGVVSRGDSNSTTVVIPAAVVRDFVNRPETTFNFNYDYYPGSFPISNALRSITRKNGDTHPPWDTKEK